MLPTPVGRFWIGRQGDGSLRSGWEMLSSPPDLVAPPEAIVETAAALLAGRCPATPCRLVPNGTPFEELCWSAAQRIPWGTAVAYGELARGVGCPGAARAVGQAMRRNPLPLLVPCHRVVAASGLGGYAGDRHRDHPGMAIKRFLLGLEASRGRVLQEPPPRGGVSAGSP